MLCVRLHAHMHDSEKERESQKRERGREQPCVGELACVGAEVVHSLGNPILLNLYITSILDLKVSETLIRYEM